MNESEFQQVPCIETSLVENICEISYGIKVASVQPMQGYIDRNYCIHDAEKAKKFVLKISRLPGSSEEQMINSQIALIKHLIKFEVPCPEIITQTDGTNWSKIVIKNMQCSVRMSSFLPGEQVGELELAPQLLNAFGDMIGRIHFATESFDHLNEINANYWTVVNALDSRAVIGIVKDDPIKFAICSKVFDCFEKTVIPFIDQLPSGVIHSDLNEENLLAAKFNDKYEITGVLDFDEIHHSCLVFDIAIAIAHLMMCRMGDEYLERGKWILAGYSNYRTLNDLEKIVLKASIETRMLQALINDLHYYSLNPTAADRQHVLDYQEAGWNQLFALLELSNEDYLQIVLGK